MSAEFFHHTLGVSAEITVECVVGGRKGMHVRVVYVYYAHKETGTSAERERERERESARGRERGREGERERERERKCKPARLPKECACMQHSPRRHAV